MSEHTEIIQKYLHNGSSSDLDNRIERLRIHINEILLTMSDELEKRCGFLHLYGVSQACAMIAMRRNEDIELAMMAGMLHDLHSYKAMNTDNHAKLGSDLARSILNCLCITTDTETDKICLAIQNHSFKDRIDSSFDEVVKDADVFHHCLYNPMFPVMSHERRRYQGLLKEFGINVR